MTMNWTGGELTRAASGRTRTVRDKQKAHFARVRAIAAKVPSSTPRPPSVPLSCSLKRSPVSDTTQCGAQEDKDSFIAPGIDAVEYQLLLKRQELLRRPDWLQLEVTKPLKLHSRMQKDKGLIGRRRKLQEPTSSELHTVAQDRQQRIHRGLPVRGFRDVNAASQQEDSLRIKIGTDALQSQTQQTGLLATESVQRRSADLDSLSEEPMLLDSDDDLFEKQSSRQGKTKMHADALHVEELADMNNREKQRVHPDGNVTRAVQQPIQISSDVHESSEKFFSWSASVAGHQSKQDEYEPDMARKDLDLEWDRGLTAYSDPWRGNGLVLQRGCDPHDHTGIATEIPASRSPKHSIHDTVERQPLRTVERVDAQQQNCGAPSEAKNSCILPADEELWRNYILGDAQSGSEQSSLRYRSRMSYLKDMYSPMTLEPAELMHRVEKADSLVATYATSVVEPASRWLSSPTTIRTTAAVASSSIA